MHVTYEMYDTLQKYARTRYDMGEGWDMVVECIGWSDLQKIADEYGCKTEWELMLEVKHKATVWAEMQAERSYY